jgi:hypothetical protein
VIDRIYILDHEERHAPPTSNVLEVVLSGDIVFLTLGKRDETYTERNFEALSKESEIAVPLVDLANALKSLSESQKRADLARIDDSKLRAVGV